MAPALGSMHTFFAKITEAVKLCERRDYLRVRIILKTLLLEYIILFQDDLDGFKNDLMGKWLFVVKVCFTGLFETARIAIVSLTKGVARSSRYQSSNKLDANLVGTRTNSSAKGIYLMHIYPNLKPLEINQELQPGLIRTLESNLLSSSTSLLLLMTSASISRPDLWSLQHQRIMTPSDNGQRHYSQWISHTFVNDFKRSQGTFSVISPSVTG